MLYQFEEGKQAIIKAVVDRIKDNVDKKQAAVCADFVEEFLSTVALEDLSDWQIDDLYAAMLNFWDHIYKKEPGEQKIRIYNPDYEKHGWQTTHTVIEIIHDDMPFLVDSVHMEINRMELTSHLLVHIGELGIFRDNNHRICKVLPYREETDISNISLEAPIFIQIDRQTNPNVLKVLHENLERVLQDTREAVADWKKMRQKLTESIKEISTCSSFVDKGVLTESKDFLSWIEDHHFTFLGVRDYELIHEDKEMLLKPIEGTGLGVLREIDTTASCRNILTMTPEARALTLSQELLVISKTNTRSTVHRPTYTDYIGIKRFDKEGKVIGERRVIGLYTSAAYNTNPRLIPFLRRKVGFVMKMSQLGMLSHAGKVLQNILDTLPRDDLFQASPETLLEIAMGIFHLQERRRIRMFARKDVYGRFISCLVFVPRDLFNTELRKEMQDILCDSFSGAESTFSTLFSDSVLARIHFVIRINPEISIDYDYKAIENKLIEVGRTWQDTFRENLLDGFGEEVCNRLFNLYGDAFPVGYKAVFTPRAALYDIKHIEQLTEESSMGMNFYRPVGEMTGSLRLKIYQKDETAPLSDVLPILENLGLRVISERPYVLRLKSGRKVWINDFGMLYRQDNHIDVDKIRARFEKAFLKTWFNKAENDSFIELVLGAGLDWREVSILRAYAKYFKQISFTFSQAYIEETLTNNTEVAKKLIALFDLRFSPKNILHRDKKVEVLKQEIIKDLDEVSNLDEDKILRRYIDVIMATLRTNYYQMLSPGKFKSYISFKLLTKKIPEVPQPHPMYEIFVYSPRFEGVHLRCGTVARGGLRWSDRREDFRTEVLGLMKAQQVKNAVIVPNGAKGGFVPKNLPIDGSREDIMAEGIACYKRFIRGLLDLTDNYVDGKVVKPKDIVCYDEDDTYLVVAADKGTATFSDIANEISNQYGFWLGDAFASGGSAGYDHKKMGITARGAWESVKRHFREKNQNIQNTEFTVIGIGDMAGDVFGNGMLLSKHTRLLGAFNHLHIFIDPNPDSHKSFKERERLFKLPRSTWLDYSQELISEGGGIFNRKAKYITLSPEIKSMFSIKESKIEPNQLIKVMLKAKVDLLWSGGIGTFVKASSERVTDVGDRGNDAIRINGNEIRAKVVGEGGNLGLTQLGRIEYADSGGAIYTDFIDNSAGVDCSDNEVNIKILLNTIVTNGDLTEKQRNQLLSDMTEDVANQVLLNNYHQTQAISLSSRQSLRNLELHSRYIDYLEQEGKLDREIEFIPDEKLLLERKLSGKGLFTPEIAVLLCYSKIIIHAQIIDSDVPEDAFLSQLLLEAFPKQLRKKYAENISSHPLRREIIATKLSNLIVNEVGFAFIYRLQDETGAPKSAIVRAYLIARTIFSLEERFNEIKKLDNVVSFDFQAEMMMQQSRLLRRSTRWFLRSERMRLDVESSVKLYGDGIKRLKKVIPSFLVGSLKTESDKTFNLLKERGIPDKLAKEITLIPSLFSSLDIVDASVELNENIEDYASIYFGIADYLELNWIRTKVIVHPTENHWEALSREALRDDLDYQQRQLASGILRGRQHKEDLNEVLKAWSNRYQHLILRWKHMLADLRAAPALNYTMYFVAIKELLDLTQTTVQATLPQLCKTIIGEDD
jgi:glutamate dehydrogenase